MRKTTNAYGYAIGDPCPNNDGKLTMLPRTVREPRVNAVTREKTIALVSVEVLACPTCGCSCGAAF